MQLRLAECALKSRVSNVLKGKLQRELKLARRAAASRALIDRRCNLPETQGVRQIGKGRSAPETLFPSGSAPLERSTITFTGSPDRAMATPLISQPPSTRPLNGHL